MEFSVFREKISSVPLTQSMPPKLRTRFAMIFWWIANFQEASKGERIYIEGAKDEETGCLLISGKVSIQKEGEETEVVTAPDILGEIQQFTRSRERTATVEAVEHCQLLTFTWWDLATQCVALFELDERTVLQEILEQYALGRCAELFDQAAKEAKD